ncbi:MAG: FAD-binding protein [Eubacterium sp.]
MKTAVFFTGVEKLEKAAERINKLMEPILKSGSECSVFYLGSEETGREKLSGHLKEITAFYFLEGKQPFLAEEYLDALEAFCDRETPELLIFYESPENNPLAVRLSYRLKGECVTHCTEAVFTGEHFEIKKKAYNAYVNAVMVKKQLPLVLTISKGGSVLSFYQTNQKKKWKPFQYEPGHYTYVKAHGIKMPKVKNPLEEKPLVFVGGKGLGTKENYLRLEEIAKALGGACGCTRAAALSGFAKVSNIIGQSGLSIRAELCIAVGVSGAGPFMAGVENVGKLAAVNCDENAPIFAGSDYGIIADASKILEEWEVLIGMQEENDEN